MNVRTDGRTRARKAAKWIVASMIVGLTASVGCSTPSPPKVAPHGGTTVSQGLAREAEPQVAAEVSGDLESAALRPAEERGRPEGTTGPLAPASAPKAEAKDRASRAARAPNDDALAGLGALSGDGVGMAVGYGSGAAAPARRKQARQNAAPQQLRMRAGGAVAELKGRPTALQMAAPTPPEPEFNTEAYAHIRENAFQKVSDSPLSTFSVDVDTASYANVRRMLNAGQRPSPDAVRIEEFINYFDYDYPEPNGDAPFSIYTETASAPWNPQHRLVHIGLRGRTIDSAAIPARNLVFLLDVSGSMGSPDKLPLLKQGLTMLTQQLRPQDRVSIVVYAGASGLVLPATSGNNQHAIREALDRLEAGGSTNGAGGIQLAYRIAQENFVKDGINRVILATDGDFNVGPTSHGDLTRLIEDKRKSGVFLTVLGFGSGNLKDSTMETLADKGNGNYAYIDSPQEAHKVLVREAGSTLVTLAKDVKMQVEWNPTQIESYRLIGYENRVMAARDFNDDTKDAGEIGAGHTVTALYEVVLRQGATPQPGAVDPLKYQTERAPSAAAKSPELLTIKFRYKEPQGQSSRLLQQAVVDTHSRVEQSSDAFRFSAAVAGFGMILRKSEFRGDANLGAMRALAKNAMSRDPHGDRHGLLELMDTAARLGIDG